MAKPLLIMKTGTLPPEMIEKYGDYEMLYPHMADIPMSRIAVVYVEGGEKPEAPDAYCGVLITGSEAMITDGSTWSEDAAAWLRDATDTGLPILGICYGHQLLTSAFGGKVDFLADGIELGTVTLDVFPEANEHRWLKDLPKRCGVNVIHSQSIQILPQNARVLGRSLRESSQIVLFAPSVLGVQFHPEFDGEGMRDYLAILAGRELSMEGLCLPLMDAAKDTPYSRSILRNFAAEALDRI